MALFFDQEWFEARLNARGLNKQTLAVVLGLHLEEVDAIWKDQREISAREVALLAELLGVSVTDIAKYGGVTTPVPQEKLDIAKALARMEALEARLGKMEMEITAIQKQLAQAGGDREKT